MKSQPTPLRPFAVEQEPAEEPGRKLPLKSLTMLAGGLAAFGVADSAEAMVADGGYKRTPSKTTGDTPSPAPSSSAKRTPASQAPSPSKSSVGGSSGSGSSVGRTVSKAAHAVAKGASTAARATGSSSSSSSAAYSAPQAVRHSRSTGPGSHASTPTKAPQRPPAGTRLGPGGELYPAPHPVRTSGSSGSSGSKVGKSVSKAARDSGPAKTPSRTPQRPPAGTRLGPGGELYPAPHPVPTSDPVPAKKTKDQASKPARASGSFPIPVAHHAKQDTGNLDPDAPTSGPALGDSPGLPGFIPFPGEGGSLSITAGCGMSIGTPSGCKPSLDKEPEPKSRKPSAHAGVEATDTETISRDDPERRSDGSEVETLGVSSDLRFTASAGVNDRKGDGLGASVFHGRRTNYDVTVKEKRADRIADGEANPPNPLDPRSLRKGEGVVLGRERYDGGGVDGSYRFVRVGTSKENAESDTAGVQRLGKRWVRVNVGDEDVVRHQMSVGVGTDDLNLSFGHVRESRDGKRRYIDLNVSTRAGWNAYQRFAKTGQMPSPLGRGRRNAATQDAWSDGDSGSTDLAAGEINVGEKGDQDLRWGSDTRYINGREVKKDGHSYYETARERTESTRSDGSSKPATTSITVQGVDGSAVEDALDARGFAYPDIDDKADIRIDFSDKDLAQLREDTIEGFTKHGTSREEVDRTLAEEREKGVQYDLGAHDIALTTSPKELGEKLNLLGRGDAHVFLAQLNELQAGDEPNPDLPGTITVYAGDKTPYDFTVSPGNQVHYDFHDDDHSSGD